MEAKKGEERGNWIGIIFYAVGEYDTHLAINHFRKIKGATT